MAHFILIHGGLHGGWCWERITPLLESAGQTAFSPDLPGMGADTTPFAVDPFAQWVDALVGWVDDAPAPVILVGHSLGGSVISQAAEYRPEKIAKLVYLSGLLRRNGETTLYEEGSVPLDVQVNEKGQMMLPQDVVRSLCYNLCSEADIEAAVARLTPQPLAVALARLSLTEARFGRVPKFYIEARFDQAVTLDVQRHLQANWPCARAATLNADHSAFFSAPQACAEAIMALA